jgi:bile acid:Na+ symporter, BASS family
LGLNHTKVEVLKSDINHTKAGNPCSLPTMTKGNSMSASRPRADSAKVVILMLFDVVGICLMMAQTARGFAFTATRTVCPSLTTFPSNGRMLVLRPSNMIVSPLLSPDKQEQSLYLSSSSYENEKVSATSSKITTAATTSNNNNELDEILAKLTSAFPFFVLGTAIAALLRPSLLQWTNCGDIITIMLSAVMWGTGLTLTKDDFTGVLKQNLSAVPVGVLCQFLIMPFSAFLVGNTVLMQAFSSTASASTSVAAAKATQELGKAAFLGLCLVGCSPGGTASNLVSLIAKADVALSVLLTSCSTLLASVATPLLVKFLVGSTIAVSGWTLCVATARVVLLPVLFGMVVNARAPNLSTSISRWTPFCSVVLVSLICGGVVAENASLLRVTNAGGSVAPPHLLPFLVASVLGLHCLGFLAGYLVPKFGLGFSERTSRTISIETGMQNSALAVVLARSIGAPPIASLPGAMSATAHSCLGSILAAFWRGRDAAAAAAASSIGEGKSTPTFSPSLESGENPDDYPELLI